jgi:hypothetical protein
MGGLSRVYPSTGAMKPSNGIVGETVSAGEGENTSSNVESQSRRKGRRWRWLLILLLIIAVIGGVGRAILPWAIRNYVNRTLDRNPLYQGAIGPVQVHLWRGAYSIHDIRISKTSGNVPVPLFSAKTLDFALQWRALLHHRIVGRVSMDSPELNFVDAPSEEESQTGEGGPWLQMIRDLFPFKINQAIIRNGSVHFRAYQTSKPVDVYLSDLNASVDNLGNIRNDTTPLVSTVQATAIAMDHAKLEFKMTLDPFSYRPTFHMVLRLLELDVTKINDLALSYGKFDFKRGWFDLVVEADSKEGQMSGYVKPLFRNLKVFSLTKDLKEDNVLQFFWQALVGFATTVFKNQSRDQFGTLVPFSGSAEGKTSTDLLATLGNLLRNAFVRAYLPRLEAIQQTMDGFTFAPPDASDSISPAEAP